jgi:hypothetical protein
MFFLSHFENPLEAKSFYLSKLFEEEETFESELGRFPQHKPPLCVRYLFDSACLPK